MKLSSRKELLSEAEDELAKIRTSLGRNSAGNLSEIKTGPSREAILAAKFFTRNWKLWYQSIDIGYEYGPMAEVLNELSDACYTVELMTKGICYYVEDPSKATFQEFAVGIQAIVNLGVADSGDYAGTIVVRDFLQVIPKFTREMDRIIKKEVEKKSKYAMTLYKTDIVEFSRLFAKVPKSPR